MFVGEEEAINEQVKDNKSGLSERKICKEQNESLKTGHSESLIKLFKCTNSQHLFPSGSLVEQSFHINSHEKECTKSSRCCFCFGKARNLLIVHQKTFYTTVPRGVIPCQCMTIDVNHIFKILPSSTF